MPTYSFAAKPRTFIRSVFLQILSGKSMQLILVKNIGVVSGLVLPYLPNGGEMAQI